MLTETESQINKGKRSVIAAVIINALLAVIKAAAGILGNSFALIADAVESTTDIFSSIIVYSSLHIASKPRDLNHPYGHGKAEPIAAIVISAILFGAAIGIGLQSYEMIITPHESPAAFTLAVLLFVIITKEALSRYVMKIGNDASSTLLKTDAWHHRSDAITSAAAFLGITFSIIVGPGYENADDWAALAVSFIIAYNAYRLFIPAFKEIMDTAPSPDLENEVRKVASEVQGVIALEKCYIRKMGIEYYVELHVIVLGSTTVRNGHAIAHIVKDTIKALIPKVTDVIIHIEPEEEIEKLAINKLPE